MFGNGKNTRVTELEAKVAELESQLAEAKKSAELRLNMLDALNESAHLGIWVAYYDETGAQTGVHYTVEFRRMLGYSEAEFPDSLETLSKIILEGTLFYKGSCNGSIRYFLIQLCNCH